MADAANDDDGGVLVRELLAFLEGADASAVVAPAIAAPSPPVEAFVDQATVPVRSIRSVPSGGATSRKRLLEDARAEASALTEQLERLRSIHGAERVAAKELALVEQRKRLRAEAECRTLREAVYTQRRFIRGLRSVFSATPRLASGLDLCRQLHLHTRLARNRSLRWGEFDLETHNTRLRSAMDVLCHETEAMTLSGDGADADTEPSAPPPLVSGETTDTGDGYSATSMSVYAVDSTDLSAVVRATSVAVRDVATLCGSGHPLQVLHDVIDVDASPASNMLYRVMAVSHSCASLGEELVIETHTLTSYKIMDDYAIVLWDFVDVDELHPASDATTISREVTGACLIRREWCDDGIERTVLRTMTTRKFRSLCQESVSKLRRFSCMTHPTSLVRGDEMLFRRIVLDQLETEKAIYTRTQALADG